jgi:glucokinase
MILGLDIGGTKTAVVLGTRSGEIVWRKQFVTAPLRGFEPVYEDLLRTAKEALLTAASYLPGVRSAAPAAAPPVSRSTAYTPGMKFIKRDAPAADGARQGEQPAQAKQEVRDDTLRAFVAIERLAALAEPVECIGVSIGGPMDSLSGVIKSPPNLPHWDNIHLKEMLTAEFSLPVYVEHDGNTGALAEWYFGAGRGYSNLVFITMGTGFGAGLILDGKLYRGSSNTAGEIGHIRIAEDGPTCFGKAGSLEGYGSGTGMAMLAQRMYPVRYKNNITVQDLYSDYLNDSDEAAAVFHTAGKYVGRGLAIIADMVNPECIILGGLGMRIGDAIVPPLLAAFNEEALKESAEICRIVPAQLGESIGDIAALSAAIYQSA